MTRSSSRGSRWPKRVTAQHICSSSRCCASLRRCGSVWSRNQQHLITQQMIASTKRTPSGASCCGSAWSVRSKRLRERFCTAIWQAIWLSREKRKAQHRFDHAAPIFSRRIWMCIGSSLDSISFGCRTRPLNWLSDKRKPHRSFHTIRKLLLKWIKGIYSHHTCILLLSNCHCEAWAN